MAIYIKNEYIKVLSICPIIIGIPLILKLTELVLNPIYKRKNERYIEGQKERLNAVNPIVVGITGSFGKTSCKKILEYFLKDTFKVVSTQKNFNTPMGIAMTIEKMKGDEQIFIAEFGARYPGDIEELCNYFAPKYGIITGACEQHLETFGCMENIYEEKFKLAKAVRENGGVCVFNINDKNGFRMWKEYRGKKISVGACKRADIYACNVRMSEHGCMFDFWVGDRRFECMTALLGKHNVQNIVLCAAMAIELGCDVEKIVEKIATLPQIKHRLEYIRANGVNILDDAYNANIYGVKSAFEVLSCFPGKHVVVCQGIVELGRDGSNINTNIGEELSACADNVILCGPNADYIKKGLKNKNFKGGIYEAKKFKEVEKYIKNIVRSGDTLLLQNDVPDIY